MTRYQKFANQLETKNKQLIELGKKKMAEEPKISMGEVLREVATIIMKNKARILGHCSNEKDKELVIMDFKAVQ